MSDVKRSIRLSEVVEKGVEGLFEFLLRYARTILLVANWRGDGLRELLRDRRRARPRYVMPLTFAAIGMFLLSLVTTAAGANPIHWIWSSQEISQNIVVNFTKEISLIAIAIGAVPALVGLLALAGVQTLLIGRRRRIASVNVFATCYAVGTQSFFLFLAPLGLALNSLAESLLEDETTFMAIMTFIMNAVMFVLVLSSLYALFFVPRFLFSALGIRKNWRNHKFRSLIITIFVLIITFGGLWLYPTLANIPGFLSYQVKPPTTPEIDIVSDIGIGLKAERLQVVVDIQVGNRREKIFAFSSASIRAALKTKLVNNDEANADVMSLDVERANDMFGRAVDFAIVEFGKTEWRRLTLIGSEIDPAQLDPILQSSGTSCLQIFISFNGDQAESVCVRQSLRKIE